MIIDRGAAPGPFSKPRDYVSQLREVFRRRCAYCLTPDTRCQGEEGMKVDHFMPESRHPDLLLSWTNLYYCCDVCNNRKSNYPTLAEINNGKRFVDPCIEDPEDHFRLAIEPGTGDYCLVASLSLAAEYEVQRLQFNRRQFLRDFWRELSAEERNWIAQRNSVIELCDGVTHEDENVRWLSTECDRRLSNLRDLWPFPRHTALETDPAQ